MHQTHGRKGDDGHVAKALHGLLVHVLRRDEQRDVAATRQKLFADGQAREKVPASAPARNGGERAECLLKAQAV